MTETARQADVILPAASFAEKTGTFTSSERRIQMVQETVPSPGVARSDWEILVDLSQYLGRPLDFALPRDIWEAIRSAVPAYSAVLYGDVGGRGTRPESLQGAQR